jgi:peptidoglycan/xylan/chitin deacetylase (PgdA/CDA1 family)
VNPKVLRALILAICFAGGLFLPANAEDKKIALTFDDELRPAVLFHEDGLLDVLRRNDARATFFVLGFQVKSEP